MKREYFTIRNFRNEDADRLVKIYRDSVLLLAACDYSDVQRSVWASLAPTAEDCRQRAGFGRWTWVAVDPGGRIAAYADLEFDGHIDQLYCAPEWGRRGAGAKLLGVIETAARESGIRRLFVEASETARPLFERAGFLWLGRRDFEVRGVPIYNHAMEKVL